MTRNEVTEKLLLIFSQRFEIDQPDLDQNLNQTYGFDSIDAIDLLREIEIMLGCPLSRDEKKKAMDIRTLNQIADYILELDLARAA